MRSLFCLRMHFMRGAGIATQKRRNVRKEFDRWITRKDPNTTFVGAYRQNVVSYHTIATGIESFRKCRFPSTWLTEKCDGTAIRYNAASMQNGTPALPQ